MPILSRKEAQVRWSSDLRTLPASWHCLHLCACLCTEVEDILERCQERRASISFFFLLFYFLDNAH